MAGVETMKSLAYALLALFVLPMVLLTLLMWVTPPGVCGEIITDLMFGWFGFLRRVGSQLTIRWDGVAIFLVGIGGVIAIAHYLLRWFFRETNNESDSRSVSWRLRSTVSVVGLIVVMFIAGTSIIGVTHQAVWLFQSEEPLYGEDLPQSVAFNSQHHLKWMGHAVHNSHDIRGTLPTRWRENPNDPPQSWATQILPYLNYQTDTIDFSREWDDPVNAASFRAVIPELCNPAFRTPPLRNSRGYGLNHFAGNRWLLDRTDPVPFQELRHVSANTLLIGEVNSEFMPWGEPGNLRDPTVGFNTQAGFGGVSGAEGVRFLMLDGSVRFVGNDISPEVLEAMSHPQ